MIFIDTNYFLRLLVKDNQKQHLIAKKTFQKAARGEIKLFTSLIVIFEIYWVLSSFYKKEKEVVCQLLKQILDLNFISLTERKTIKKALTLHQKTSLDLEDSYNLFYSKKLKSTDFSTFDLKLKKAWVKTK